MKTLQEINKIAALMVLGSVILMHFNSCQVEDPTPFNESDGIYFDTSVDSLVYSFAKYPKLTVDTVKIPIAIVGDASIKDRTITVEGVQSPLLNAVEGVHYKLLPPYIIPAKSYKAFIKVVLYRTADMNTNVFAAKVRIKENENFKVGITAKSDYLLKIAYIQKPANWGTLTGLPWAGFSGNFGTWTPTKYKMILDALYNPVTGTTVTEFLGNRPGSGENLPYLQMVKNYLINNYPGNFSTPIGIGATLRDPDANNAIILVGPANY